MRSSAKPWSKILSFTLAVALAATMMPGGMLRPIRVKAYDYTYDLSSGPVTIPNTCTDALITGSLNTGANHGIQVESGFNGTITLRGVDVRTTNNNYAAMLIGYNAAYDGDTDQDATANTTKVRLVLDGANTLWSHSNSNDGKRAGLEVWKGAEVHIRAIDENDNSSGTLKAEACKTRTTTEGAGAGIGQGNVSGSGGDVIISSGTVNAYAAYHGAGIGGSWTTANGYNGTILIYGGVVNTFGGAHGAGIGGGCGNVNYPVSHDTGKIVVLPGAQIQASTSGTIAQLVGNMGTTVYIGDPGSPEIYIRTADYEKNADIYMDLSDNLIIKNAFLQYAPGVDISRVHFGKTGNDGFYKINAELQDPVVIFTDATSSQPATSGKPYEPVKRSVPSGAPKSNPIILPLLNLSLSFDVTQSVPLRQGYSAAEAEANAYRLKLTYSDTEKLTNVSVGIQGDSGGATEFSALQIADSSGTPTTVASTWTGGEAYSIKAPLKTGKPINIYQDTILIKFEMNVGGIPMDYTLRQVVKQKVVLDDTGTNNHIRVTASPASFITNNSTAQTVNLSMTIDHGSILPAYDQSDVTAKYIITTEENYAAISSADPGWTAMTTNATGTTAAVTTATFPTSMAAGEYYIHWYVESGAIMAHSENFSAPMKPNGAFGKYIIDKMAPAATIVVNNDPAATQEITDLTSLPVKITFTKPIDPASFTVSDFVIAPSGMGTISALTAVTGSDDQEFTATFTPSGNIPNGQQITLKLPAGSVTDKVGNASAADSNEVTLRFKMDGDIPTVSFQNLAVYKTLTPSFDIGLDPGDTAINSNTSLYLDSAATTAVANGDDLAGLFTVQKVSDGTVIPTSGYTVIYNASAKKAVITFTAAAGLINSAEYKVSIAPNKLYNKLQNGNAATDTTFKIGIPEVTGITPVSTTVPYKATGIPTLTVNGVNFDQIPSGAISVEQTNPDGTTIALTATVTDPAAAALTVTLPANSENVSKTYSFQAKSPVISGSDEGAPAQIIVRAASPELGTGDPSVKDALSADPDFIENDETTRLGGDSVLTITGENLHNFTGLEIRGDDGSVHPIAPAAIYNDNTKADVTVSLPFNPAIDNKVYTYEVYHGGTASGHKATVTVEGSKPKVTGVTANPEEHSSAGGTSLFTIIGRYLNNAFPLELVDSLGGTYVVPPANIATDGRSATLSIGFSGNAGPRNDIHVLEAHIAGSGTGESAAVEVGDSIPFVEDAKASPFYFSSGDTKNKSGRSTITIYGGYLTRATSLEIYDVVNRATYTVSRTDDDVNTYVVTVPSNPGVYTYNILLDGIDTGYSVYVQVGGTPPLGASDIPEPEEDPGDGEEGGKRPEDKEWTGRGGGAKGGVWSGGWYWTVFDIIYHHARSAVKENPDDAFIVLRDVWCITQGHLDRAASGARADRIDGAVTIHFETMDTRQPSVMEGRLMINPFDASFFESHLYPMVFTRESLTGKTKSLFASRFDNRNIEVVRLSQIGEYNARLEIAANIELKGFDREHLYFYLYVPETGEYRQISDPEYSFDEDGYLHFFTDEGGDIVVTDKPLTQNGAAFQPGSFPVDRKSDEDEKE